MAGNIYAIGDGIQIYDIDTLDYIGNISGTTNSPVGRMCRDSDYIYFAGFGTSDRFLRKYDASSFELITGITITYNCGAITVDDNYIYVAQYVSAVQNGYIRKYDKTTLALVATSAAFYAFMAMELINEDDDYLLSSTYNIIRRIAKSDLSEINIYSSTGISWKNSLKFDDNYIYSAGSSGIIKLTLSGLTLVTGITGTFYGLTLANNYLYANQFVAYNGRIKRYDKDLNYINSTSVVIDSYTGWFVSSDSYYIYGGGENTKQIKKFKQITLDYNDISTVSAGGTNGIYYDLYVYGSATAEVDNPPSFCETAPYTVSGSTCGNADGKITIVNQNLAIYASYFDVYDFTLTDVTGGTYTFNTTTGEATGLTSNYYFLTATVKPEYWYYYGRDDCSFEWIKIEDADNPAYLVGVSVRPLQCQPFDKQYGRIYYNVSGLTSVSTYAFYAYTSDLTLYYQKTGITSTEDFILANADAQCYWVLIRDEVTGCALLLDNRCVPSISSLSTGGIKKLWIAKWTDDLDYNYWSTKDDDYFLEFEDTSFFLSTKIKEFLSITGGTIQWYEIPVLPKVVNVSQKLDKVRQGYIFTDNLNIGIAKANATKWTQMATIINPENKWVYVVQTIDDFYWCGGYRHGARISAYSYQTGARGEDNGYKLTITAVSENKLLTNLDENYVINSII